MVGHAKYKITMRRVEMKSFKVSCLCSHDVSDKVKLQVSLHDDGNPSSSLEIECPKCHRCLNYENKI